jgi:Acyl-CoA synthetases (AMP-forming)/AMP-acid ligases II
VPVLAAGGTIVLHAGFDAAEVWATVAKERCTVVLGVPTIWKLLLEHPSFAAADLSSIRWLISGGAPLRSTSSRPTRRGASSSSRGTA